MTHLIITFLASTMMLVNSGNGMLFREVYPLIDLHVYTNDDRMEYDFIVKPGGDITHIHIMCPGFLQTGINDAGHLELETETIRIIHQRPTCYQIVNGNILKITGTFIRIGKNDFGFSVGEYLPEYDLIIDPVVFMEFSTYLGGAGAENQNIRQGSIAVDDTGFVYVCGTTTSVNFPTRYALQPRHGGGTAILPQDVFVSKLSPNGSHLVYSTFLGGKKDDFGMSLVLDNTNHAYITGFTYSDNFPTLAAFQPAFVADTSAFVSKLHPAGNKLVYSTYLGETAVSLGMAIAVDADGSAYVAGVTQDNGFPTVNPFQGLHAGPTKNDAFVSRFNLTGKDLIFSTLMGGSERDTVLTLAIDDTGCSYIAGVTDSPDFPTMNAFQTTGGITGNDGFVAKLDTAGNNLVFSTYLGGSRLDQIYGLAVDAVHNVYLTGNTESDDYPTIHAFQKTLGGSLISKNGFITKMNAAGDDLVYSTYLGGSQTDTSFCIALDTAGNACVAGFTQSTDFPTFLALFKTFGGNYDAFVTKLNATGDTLVYSTYFGGLYFESAMGIAVDLHGDVYFTGGTTDDVFPTKNAFQDVYGGGFYDAYVAKLSFMDPVPAAPIFLTCLLIMSFVLLLIKKRI